MTDSGKTKLQWSLCLAIITGLIYCFAGNPRLVHEYYTQANMTNRIRNKQLQPLNNDLQKELVYNLLLIDEQRTNATAWFGIAKIYELQGQYALAQDAYYNLMNLEPDNDFFFKQFVKMSSKDTKGILGAEIRQKLLTLVKKQEDITYLNLLAIDAYNQEQYMHAAAYWLRVYNLAQSTNTNNDLLTDIQVLIENCKQQLKS
jgi:cytochrome c-type biogenesis protein CcmH/NrfG